MAKNKVHNIGAIMLLFLSFSANCQSGDFLLWQIDKGFENPIYYIPKECCDQFENLISIDTNFNSLYGNIKVWQVKNNNEIKYYRLKSIDGLTLSKADKFKKRLHIVTEANYYAMQPYANIIIDSLKSSNSIFVVSPSIDTKFQYVLQTDAYYKNFLIDSTLSKRESDSVAYVDYYKKFKDEFLRAFPNINRDQLILDGFRNEMVTITINLEKPNFDFQKLKEMNVYFRNEPMIRKTRFNIQVFQEYLK